MEIVVFFEIVYCVYWVSFKRCLVGDYERWITRSNLFVVELKVIEIKKRLLK